MKVGEVSVRYRTIAITFNSIPFNSVKLNSSSLATRVEYQVEINQSRNRRNTKKRN